VGDNDTEVGGRNQVHVVDAHAVANHPSTARQAFHHPPGNGSGADEDDIGVAQVGDELIFVPGAGGPDDGTYLGQRGLLAAEVLARPGVGMYYEGTMLLNHSVRTP
jgi:hypothetical protein